MVILGAGAAGLMCAMTAGQRGRRVLVLERANKVGKKILMSGGGRCNFTNLYVEPDRFISSNPDFCRSALSRYTQWDFIELVKRHRIPFHEKAQGQLFCDESSKAILTMLLKECAQVGVEIEVGCTVDRIASGADFRLATGRGEFRAETLVVATGGLSVPTLGGSGFGYEVARQFGLHVLPCRAGLVPFTFTDAFQTLSSRLSGLSVAARVSTGSHSFTDAILFTHRGLSGPAVLQLSTYWQPGEAVLVDVFPNRDASELLKQLKQAQPRAVLRTGLSQHLPKNLVAELEALWWPEWADKSVAEVPGQVITDLAGHLHRWEVKPAATEGYRTAEVTVGGVDTRGLSSKTMASLAHPGLYFIGEVVDVTGHLGGFNFQWAWSSGYVAGQTV